MTDYFAVLTGSKGVPDDAIAHVAGQLPSPVINRLWSDAVEIGFSAPEMPALRVHNLDLNIVPAENRQKKLLIADMDSTIIPVECIDELADFAGVKREVSEITERAMQGELGFEEAIDARVGLLKDLPVSALEECYATRISLNPGARDLLKVMNANGAYTALVSGGFTFFTERVAKKADFKSNQANRLEIADNRLTGKVERPILGRAAKAKALRRLCETDKITPQQVIAVGDGANDLDMIRLAGLGVAFHAKPALKAEADAILDHSDLGALLALQGLKP